MTNPSAAALFTMGEDWRTEIPGLWAILRGRGSEVRIAQLLGWPIQRVRLEMHNLSVIRMVNQNSKGTWTLNRAHENYETYLSVRKLYQAIDRKLMQEFPSQVNVEELSLIIRDEARAGKKAAQGAGPEPTEIQLKILTVAHRAFGREGFNPLALAKAQGYTQAGWSK